MLNPPVVLELLISNKPKFKKIHSRDQKYLNILKIVSHFYKHNKILNLFYFGHWLKIQRSSEQKVGINSGIN